MTKTQENVLKAIKGSVTAKRVWMPIKHLACFDGRSVAALLRQGRIEINLEYGVRPL